MQIAAAHAHGADAQQDVGFADFGYGHVAQFNR
jgi:hypothetical protein